MIGTLGEEVGSSSKATSKSVEHKVVLKIGMIPERSKQNSSRHIKERHNQPAGRSSTASCILILDHSHVLWWLSILHSQESGPCAARPWCGEMMTDNRQHIDTMSGTSIPS
jgi:hypothetical protein